MEKETENESCQFVGWRRRREIIGVKMAVGCPRLIRVNGSKAQVGTLLGTLL